MLHKKSFIKNSLLATVGHILVYAKGIILLPILIKSIGISLYGGYVLLMTGMGFISGISTFGVGFKFKRFIPSAEGAIERRDLFYPQFFFQLMTAFLVSILLIISSNFIKTTIFKDQIVFSMYLVAFILIVYVLYSVSTDFFRYTHRMNYFTIATTSEPYLNILFIIVAIHFFHKKTLNFLLLAYLFALILVAIPLLIKICKEMGFKLPVFRIKNFVEDIRLGFPLVLSYVVDFVLSGSDRFVIAVLISTTAVGYYSPAYTLGSLIILFPRVFGVVLPPLLSRATDKGKENEVKVLVDYSIKFFLLIAIPFIAGSYVLSMPLLEILSNKEVANAAYLAIPIIAGGVLFYGLNLILSNILFVKLKTTVIFGINALSAILNLFLNVIFIYIFRSILIAAITTLVSYLVSFIILNVKIKKYLKINYDFSVVLKCLLSSAFMGITLYYMKITFGVSLSILLLSIFISVILYFILLFIFKAFSVKEINYIKHYISPGLKR